MKKIHRNTPKHPLPQDCEQFIRTDLAEESHLQTGGGQTQTHLPGLRFQKEIREGIPVTRLQVTSEEGAQAIGKPLGEYITVTPGNPIFQNAEDAEKTEACLCGEIRAMARRLAPHCRSVLVAGLGNRLLTVDAVGPQTVDAVTVTRHLETLDPPLFASLHRLSVAAVAPGVTGQTGMDTAALLRRCVEEAKPDLLLVIDALAARSTARLCTTVQLSDSGIAPGSGVGNRGGEISRATMGIPVIAVGVPTVADSSTLVMDALEKAGITEISPALKTVLEEGRSFFVSLKDSDAAVAALSARLAGALDRAFLKEN